MLPKSQRLNLKKDFKWVAAGKKLETKYLKLFVKVGDNQMPRVGIAVSGKSFKKAVERNRARRLTSAAFEALYPNLPSTINIVALPKSRVINVKSGELLLDLEAVLRNEKIIN
ncbi:MAG: ribonuclease P protein component [Candidatus Daviesbacteria bacterium]|nr:ribonuclease P protein component [Candidatus Daviesbacteria bacterium]